MKQHTQSNIENKSFKEQMVNEIIPLVEEMVEKEKNHLQWLIDNKASKEMIQKSQRYYNRYQKGLNDYVKYTESL